MNNTHSSRARSTVLPLVLTALFAALTAIGAFLRIPAGEISFTLQVFFTSMAGILLGPWWGAASQVVYVLLGLIGLPIFTEGGGLMYLAKPSCGFLLGLPLMAMVIGLLTRDLKASTLRGHAVRGMLRIALACVAGLAVLYLIGLPYMYFVLAGKWSIQKTIVSGCLIFLPFDALKIVVTTLLCVRLLPVLNIQFMMSGAIMLLIQGLALTNSVRDMLVGHTISGLLRLSESLLLAGALALGFGGAMFLFGV